MLSSVLVVLFQCYSVLFNQRDDSTGVTLDRTCPLGKKYFSTQMTPGAGHNINLKDPDVILLMTLNETISRLL